MIPPNITKSTQITKGNYFNTSFEASSPNHKKL